MSNQHPPHIEQWLEAFWQGESTLEQEAAINAYFQDTASPGSLTPEKAYFDYLRAEKERKLESTEFDDRVLRQIKWKKYRQLGWKTIQMAAGLALLLSLGWWYHVSHTHIESALPTSAHRHAHWQPEEGESIVERYFSHYEQEKGVEYLVWGPEQASAQKKLKPLMDTLHALGLKEQVHRLHILRVDSLHPEVGEQLYREAYSMLKHLEYEYPAQHVHTQHGAHLLQLPAESDTTTWVILKNANQGCMLSSLAGTLSLEEITRMLLSMHPRDSDELAPPGAD